MSKKAFIGGPISHLFDGGICFNEEFIEIHKKTIQMLEQLGYQILSAHIVEDYGKNKTEPDEVIVERDLKWIEEASLCIFLFPVVDNEAIRTDGTYIELGFAAANCKNNLCFWDEQKPNLYSPMFRGMTVNNVKLYDISNIEEVLSKLE